MTAGNQKTAYQYNKNEELLRTNTLNTDTNTNAVTLYKNDKNGNQLAVVNRQETDTKEYFDLDVSLGDNRLNENAVYHYNAENQLQEVITGKNKVQYEYDASGLRTKKTVNGKETIYVWDGDQIVLELNANGKVKRRYIRGNDLIYTDEGEGTKKQYYVTDLHGNVVQLLDESGKIVKSYEYDAFGNEVDADKKDENPYRYCGEYYDKETESVYLRARYYQSGLGRFLTRDTYTGEENELLSLHLYTYCENDAVNAVDPSGHEEIVVSGGIYKMSKHDGYCYEFIEPALKQIFDFYKKLGRKNILWLIADNGWTENEKEIFKEQAFRIGKVRIKFFRSRKGFINILNRTNKSDPIKSFTVFSHGFKRKLAFGYAYEKANSFLDLRVRHLNKINKNIFDKPSSHFYSCNTAQGYKRSFANSWQWKTNGIVVAYAGKTNYKYINSEYSGFSYYIHRLGEVVTGEENQREYPRKSMNYPTGKGKVIFKPTIMTIR